MLRQRRLDASHVPLEKRFGIGQNVRTAKLAAGAGEPVWNVIMPAGEWHRPDFPNGVIKCDRAFFASVIANWKKVGSPGLPIDRFHWGSSDDTRVTDPKAKAAVGFIEDLRISASGDLEALTRWNADGKADIEADRFRYFSPTFHEDWRDASTGERQGPTLFGGALLNDPYFKTLPRLAANDVPAKENVMNREELIALYGLKADTTEAEIKAAVQAGATARKAASEADEKRTASEKRTGELETELKKANDAREAQEKRIAALEGERKAEQTKALVDRLEREGRILAAEKADVEEDVKAYGLAKATERWLKRPVIVKMASNGIAGGANDDQSGATKKLEIIAEEIATKEKVVPSVAFRRACERNPELYKASMATTQASA